MGELDVSAGLASEIGRVFTAITAVVDAGRLRVFTKAIGDDNPLFTSVDAAVKAGYSNITIPPTYLFCLQFLAADDPFEFIHVLGIEADRILHAEQSFSYYAPVAVGDRLTFEPVLTHVEEKKGGALTFLTVTTRISDPNGHQVADSALVVAVRNR
jgi:acyl dehydratase